MFSFKSIVSSLALFGEGEDSPVAFSTLLKPELAASVADGDIQVREALLSAAGLDIDSIQEVLDPLVDCLVVSMRATPKRRIFELKHHGSYYSIVFYLVTDIL